MTEPLNHDQTHSGHEHGAGSHSHAPTNFGRSFAIGIVLNVGFVITEAAFGLLANSMALLADAGHNLSDVLGLVVAKRGPSRRFTYGLKGSSILAACSTPCSC